ncbi:MAG TPA: DNRLRE domain-containing protein [Candidatus Woesearchaeota archaeon]|nr:DNRLRE domain-containing protein [Candidatus Woesearchaeota archaeon]
MEKNKTEFGNLRLFVFALLVITVGLGLSTSVFASEVCQEDIMCYDENECTFDSCNFLIPELSYGECSYEVLPDGTSCMGDGTCNAGVCITPMHPFVWTDKANYESDETVHIYGMQFDYDSVDIRITIPSNPISYDWIYDVTVSSQNNFQTEYLLIDGIVDHYNIDVYESGKHDVILASTSFYDDPSIKTALFYLNGDSYVNQFNPSTNFGSSAFLNVNDRTLRTRRAYLEFNLSNATSVIPAGATIIGANMNLRLTQTVANSNTLLSVHRIAGSWSESGITWYNRPTYYSANTVQLTVDNTPTPRTVSFNVTPDFLLFYNGTTNRGWVIKHASEGESSSSERIFCSKESPDMCAPVLEVQYQLPLTCTDHSNITSCQADSNCKWCADCNTYFIFNGQSQCIDIDDTCSYNGCNIQTCGAQCEQDLDCADKCVGNTLYTSGTCGLTTCDCSYSSTFNCDSLDGYYNTTDVTNQSFSECQWRLRVVQEQRDYYCTSQGCDYSLTGNTQYAYGPLTNKEDGTQCNDGNLCTEGDVCASGVCVGTAKDCSANDITGIATCNNNPDNIQYTWDYRAEFTSTCNPQDGVCSQGDSTINHECSIDDCDAECEQDSDCGFPKIEDDYCLYDGECSGCLCKSESAYCPTPGTVKEEVCYFGERSCTQNGCTIESLDMGCRNYCNSTNGPKDTTGPITSNLVVVPNPSSWMIGYVNITALETEDCTDVIDAEYFFDPNDLVGCSDVLPGSGQPLLAFDGSYDSTQEAVFQNFAPLVKYFGGIFYPLSDGAHTLCVRGKNQDGFWGACKCVPIDIDLNPPESHETSLNGIINATELLVCGENPTLRHKACDTESFIQLAEYFVRPTNDFSDAVNWQGIYMDPVDGSYNDNFCEETIAIIDISDLPEGTNYVKAHAKDTVENWFKLTSVPALSFIKDTTAPDTTKELIPYEQRIVECDLEEFGGFDITNGCYYVTQGTQITLSAIDPDPQGTNEFAGDVKIKYIVWWKLEEDDNWVKDQEGESNIDTPITITLNKDSYHMIEYWSVDACGNEEEHHFELDIVDTKSPISEKIVGDPKVAGGQHEIDTFYDGVAPTDGVYYVTQQTPITITCTDQEPHPVNDVSIYYRYYLYGEEVPEFTKEDSQVSFTYDEDSAHVLEWYCVDALGNAENKRVEYDIVDTLHPLSSKTVGEPKVPCTGVDSYETITIFEDDFEDYTYTSGLNLYSEMNGNGWIVDDYAHPYNDDDIFLLSALSNTFVGVQDDSSIIATFDTTDLYDIELSYDRKTSGLESSDRLRIGWRVGDSGAWTSLENVSVVSSWENKVWTLTGAENKPLIQVRFFLDNGNNDVGHIDNVLVTAKRAIQSECDYYVTQNTPFTLTCIDQDPHPVNDVTIHYRHKRIDQTDEWKEFSVNSPTVTFSYPEDSEHILEWYCVDALGNAEPVQTEYDIVDTQAPETTKTVLGPQMPGEGFIHKYITKDSTIVLSCSDLDPHPVGGEILYWSLYWNEECIDPDYDWGESIMEGSETDGYVEITGLSDSCHKLVYWCVDALGNSETKQVEIDAVDNLAPISSKILGEPKVEGTQHEIDTFYDGISPTDGVYYVTQETPITLNCADPMPHPVNGVEIYYRTYLFGDSKPDFSKEESNTYTFNYEEDSAHVLEWYCVDALGNEEDLHIEYDIVDTLKPITTKTITGPQVDGIGDINKYITSESVITLECEDQNPHPVGGETLHWSLYWKYECMGTPTRGANDWELIASGSESDGFKDITDLDDSCHKLTYWCEDALGNAEEVEEGIYVVDNLAPIASKELSGNYIATSETYPASDQYHIDDQAYFVNQDTLITLSCQDSSPHPVGGEKIFYKIYNDGYLISDWQEYTQPFTYQEDTWHELFYYCIDALGNKGDTHRELDIVDTLHPISSKTVGDPKVACEVQTETITEILFEDNFSQTHPLDTGWIGDYLEYPDSQSIYNDIGTTSGALAYDGYSAFIEDDAALIRTISTKDYENIKLSYCRRTYDTTTSDRFRVGWMIGEYTDTPGEWNDNSTNWDAWNELESIRELWDCVSFTLPSSAENQEAISIAFFLDNGEGDYALLDNVLLTGDYLIPGCDYYVTQNTPFTLTCIDQDPHPVNDVTIHYRHKRIDQADEWKEFSVNSPTVTFSYPEDSEHILEWYCVDALGNTEPLQTEYDIVDTLAPISFKEIEGPTYHASSEDIVKFNLNSEEANVFWLQDHVSEITIYSDDPYPHPVGLDYVHIELWWDSDGDDVIDTMLWEVDVNPDSMPYTFTIDEDCLHLIKWYGVDLLGNTEITREQYHRVDSTPPETIKTIDGPTYQASDSDIETYNLEDHEIDNFYVTSETQITLTPIDKDEPCAVGVDYYYYEIWWDSDCDGVIDYALDRDQIFGDTPITFNFEEECLHEIRWGSVDLLGNIETQKTQRHKVDNTPPHILILKPVNGWYSDGESIPAVVVAKDLVNPHGTCQDPLAQHGCASGIEDGKLCKAYLVDILPEFKIVELESHLYYNAHAMECQGYAKLVDTAEQIEDGIAFFAVSVEDNLGNEGNSIKEILHAISMNCGESPLPGCVGDVIQDIITIWNLPKIGIDNQGPVVTIEEPIEEAELCGLKSYNLKATVSDGEEGDVTSTITSGTPCYVEVDGIALGTIPFDANTGICEGDVTIPKNLDSEKETHTLSVKITDNSGNLGVGSVELVIDTTDPTVKITSPLEGSDVFGIVEITWESDEHTTDMLSIDGALPFEATSPYLWDTTIAEEGAHLIKVSSTDRCGFIADNTIILQVDNTPTCISFVRPTHNNYYNDDQIVEVIGTDKTSKVLFDSTCSEMPDDFDGSDGFESMLYLTDVEDGLCTITATAYDELDLEICSKELTLYVDTIGPEMEYAEIVDEDFDGYDNDGILSLVFQGSDFGIGLDHYVVRVYNGDLEESSVVHSKFATFSGIPDGEWCAMVYGVDKLGNSGEEIDAGCIIVDTKKPSKVEVYSEEVEAYPFDTDGEFDVLWTDSYDESGIKSYDIMINGDIINDISYPYNQYISVDGTYTYKVRAIDNAGNLGEWSDSYTVIVDTTAPEVMIINPISTGVYGEKTTLSVLTNEDTICEFSFDEFESSDYMQGESTIHSASLTELTEGVNEVFVRCMDKAGHTTFESVSFVVTNQRPQTFATVIDPYFTVENPLITAQTMSLTNPIDEAKYCIRRPHQKRPSIEETNNCFEFNSQDGEFDEHQETLESTIDISELSEGIWVVYTNSKDATGWGEYDAEMFTIDRIPPIIDMITPSNGDIIKGYCEYIDEYEEDYYEICGASIEYSVKTNEPSQCSYSIDESEFSIFEYGEWTINQYSEMQYLADGMHTLEVCCIDYTNGENGESCKTVEFQIDSKAPTAYINELPEVSTQTFMVSWDGQDDCGGSGIDSYNVEYTLGESGWMEWITDSKDKEASFSASEGSAICFRVWAKDLAGNTGAFSQAVCTYIDSQAPVVTSALPTGIIENTEVTLEVTTNELAHCEYNQYEFEYG